MAGRARIFQQPKNAMQSGTAGTQEWILEFEPSEARRADPLMGWSGSADTRAQIRLTFASKDEALAYAGRQNLACDVEIPHERKFRPKAYADNFKFGRRDNWTH